MMITIWSGPSRTKRTAMAEKRFFVMAMAIPIGAIGHVMAVYGQDLETKATSRPVFEVVSVKPSGSAFLPGLPGEKVYSRTRPLRYSGRSLTVDHTLRVIIQEAYSVEDWAIVGPAWIDSLTYEVAATMPHNTGKEAGRLMLRAMLAERFSLKFHFEKRDIPVYALVEGRDGFKLHDAPAPATSFGEMFRGRLVATGTLDSIAAYSRRYADRPVLNMTGIKGIYHIELHWTPDDTDNSERQYDPAFWDALERAVGLKAQNRKLPRDVIVIDHVERVPTPN